MKQSFMKKIAVISKCAALYREKQLEKYGLNGYQAPYITEICRNPGITQDSLAKNIHVNRSSVTRQLALLEENGYITRTRNQNDRREIFVYPTEKCIAILPEIKRVYKEWRELTTEGMTQEEIEILEKLLDKIVKKAEEI